jgi:hypothetical protein
MDAGTVLDLNSSFSIRLGKKKEWQQWTIFF